MRESKGRVLFLRYKPLVNSRKSINEDDLTKISEKFGKVTRVVIIRPKFNGPMTHVSSSFAIFFYCVFLMTTGSLKL